MNPSEPGNSGVVLPVSSKTTTTTRLPSQQQGGGGGGRRRGGDDDDEESSTSGEYDASSSMNLLLLPSCTITTAKSETSTAAALRGGGAAAAARDSQRRPGSEEKSPLLFSTDSSSSSMLNSNNNKNGDILFHVVPEEAAGDDDVVVSNFNTAISGPDIGEQLFSPDSNHNNNEILDALSVDGYHSTLEDEDDDEDDDDDDDDDNHHSSLQEQHQHQQQQDSNDPLLLRCPAHISAAAVDYQLQQHHHDLIGIDTGGDSSFQQQSSRLMLQNNKNNSNSTTLFDSANSTSTSNIPSHPSSVSSSHRRRRTGGGNHGGAAVTATKSRKNKINNNNNNNTADGDSSSAIDCDDRGYPKEPGLRASLDAGMASMRRWIRSRSSALPRDTSNTTTSNRHDRTSSLEDPDEERDVADVSEEDQFLLPNAAADRLRNTSHPSTKKAFARRKQQYQRENGQMRELEEDEEEITDEVLRRQRAQSEPDALSIRDLLGPNTLSNTNQIRRRRQHHGSHHQSTNETTSITSTTSTTTCRRRAFTTSAFPEETTTRVSATNTNTTTTSAPLSLSAVAALEDAAIALSSVNNNIPTENSNSYHMWQQLQQQQQQPPQGLEQPQQQQQQQQQRHHNNGCYQSANTQPPLELQMTALNVLQQGMAIDNNNDHTPTPALLGDNAALQQHFRDSSSTVLQGHSSERSSHSNNNIPTSERDFMQTPANDNIIQQSPTDTSTEDPERLARLRWIQINRRFQLVITVVALVFSLLLFAILICWVILTSAFVISFDKSCDIPLKPYFWLVTLQLVLDVFRNDIMRFVFNWDSNSSQRIPFRVIAYNVAYLLYALLVLRLGIKSVYMYDDDKSSCRETAPDFFNATVAFVSLSIAAWTTILCGYLLPFCVVAALLTCNGYNPSSPSHLRDNDAGGSGGTQAVFPAAYTLTAAPPNCVEQLPVISMDSFPADYPRECCICIEEFTPRDVVVETNCRHVFHKTCCREWLRHSRTCPVCRDDIPTSNTCQFSSDTESPLESPRRNEAQQNNTNTTATIPIGPTGRPVVGLIRMLRQTSGLDTSSRSHHHQQQQHEDSNPFRGSNSDTATTSTTGSRILTQTMVDDDSSSGVDLA